MRQLRVRLIVLGLLWGQVLPAAALSNRASQLIQELAAEQAPPDFHQPVVERTLRNGMRCFFVEDPVLPLFRFALIFPGGAVYDPADKTGMQGLLANVLQTGGTLTKTPEAIDAELDAKAISLAIQTGWEQGSATVESLADMQTDALAVLFELLYAPRFDPERVILAKKNLLDAIRRQNERPEQIGARVFRKLLYGPDSAWARTATGPEVEAMTAEDLRALHATMLAPAQMFCAAAGRLRVGALVKTVERLMGQYPEHGAATWTPPEAPVRPRPGRYFLPKALPQAVVFSGQRGIARDDPDKFPLYVANEILGSPSTFTSWLVSNIRTKRGLAYEAWSAVQLGPAAAPGLFQAHAKTRSTGLAQTVTLMQQLIAQLAEASAVTEDDVQTTRDALQRRMIFQYADPFAVVKDMAQYVYLGLPAHYADTFREGIRQVTLADVQRAARTILHPDQLTTVVVGDPTTVLPELEKAGPVEHLSLQEW